MVVQGAATALTAEGLTELSYETAQSNERAVSLFERALGVDAGFAAAYMAHVDLTAVEAIRGNTRAACNSLRTAIAAGWRYPSLAARDRLFENLRPDQEFLSLIAA